MRNFEIKLDFDADLDDNTFMDLHSTTQSQTNPAGRHITANPMSSGGGSFTGVKIMAESRPETRVISQSYHVGDLESITIGVDNDGTTGNYRTVAVRVKTLCGDRHEFIFFISPDGILPEIKTS